MASLELGEITFNDFEVPEYFSIGGKQHLVIHMLPGGGRVVDAMGAEDAPIRWSGVFSGQQASERVQVLEALRRGGQPQLFTWGSWRSRVIVQQFEARVSNAWWIPYQIQLCTMSSNPSTGTDWLDRATPPVLGVGLLSEAALGTAIGVASAALGSSDVGQAMGAAGTLAQYVTARAYGLFAT